MLTYSLGAFLTLLVACPVIFICFYLGSRSGKHDGGTTAAAAPLTSAMPMQPTRQTTANERRLRKPGRLPKPPSASQRAQVDNKCALEYCKYYDDVAGGTNKCNTDNVRDYQKHWLLHGKTQHRHRCGNITQICDRIWRGDFGEESIPAHVDIVVAHCNEDMSWLTEFITRVNKVSLVRKVTVMSKCGKSTRSAPLNSTIITLPNHGRNDHTYAHYMLKEVLEDETLDDKSVIFFVKGGAPSLVHRAEGDTQQHRSGLGFMPILLPTDYALKIASATGFSCLVEHYPSSLYHNVTVLKEFNLTQYGVSGKKTFKSKFSNLEDWWNWTQQSAHAVLPQQRQIVPVCYEGNFVVRVGNIRRQKKAWKHFEAALSRGDNIEEGHFMERTWALILKDEAGDLVLDIPHHAAQISKAYGSVQGRYARCTPDYHYYEPEDVRIR